jgi:hypothetical protein
VHIERCQGALASNGHPFYSTSQRSSRLASCINNDQSFGDDQHLQKVYCDSTKSRIAIGKLNNALAEHSDHKYSFTGDGLFPSSIFSQPEVGGWGEFSFAK